MGSALSLILLLGMIIVALVTWWWLLDWVFLQFKPRLNRWIWRRLGGSGDPPSDLDDRKED